MSDKTCSERVYSGDRWRPKQCTKPVTVERDGQSYCTIHDPERVARKNAERQAAWQERWAAQSTADRVRGAAPRMLAALKALVEIDAAENPLRTADCHAIGCSCRRCAFDAARAAIREAEGK